MEVRARLGDVLQPGLVRLDQDSLRRLNPRRYPFVATTIDAMGHRSAEAQNLKRSLTSYEKIMASDDPLILYLLWEPVPDNANLSRVIGLLKVSAGQFLSSSDQTKMSTFRWVGGRCTCTTRR